MVSRDYDQDWNCGHAQYHARPMYFMHEYTLIYPVVQSPYAACQEKCRSANYTKWFLNTMYGIRTYNMRVRIQSSRLLDTLKRSQGCSFLQENSCKRSSLYTADCERSYRFLQAERMSKVVCPALSLAINEPKVTKIRTGNRVKELL
jgi:hypothetical protein